MEEHYTHLWQGCTANGTWDSHPDEYHGGQIEELVIPAYWSEPQDSPLPNICTHFQAPEDEQLLQTHFGDMMPLYPVNPEVHWLAHGTYLMPSAKLH